MFYRMAIAMDVIVTGTEELLAALDKLPATARAAAVRGITRATTLVWRESVKNAPRSPTAAQKARFTRKTRRDTSARRKATAHTRAKPGGLERSISMDVNASAIEGAVFVARNAEAGKYAKRIHDEKGSSWQNRGPGTIAKGPRADELFISRALEDNRPKIDAIMAEEMRKVDL